MENKNNTFEELSKVDLTDHVKQKLGLSYVSWAWAWAEVKKKYPDATYKIYTRKITTTETVKNSNYNSNKDVSQDKNIEIVTQSENEINYFTDYKTCWVKIGVTINGIEQTQQLPVMDLHNKSIAYNDITSVDVNKAIQRCLVKAIAMHGLGLYIYAGEDLPEKTPVVLDAQKAQDEADSIKEVPATEKDKFEQHRNRVISLIKILSVNKIASDIVIAYTTTILPKQKISEVTVDKYLEIYKLEAYLVNIKKQIDG